MTGRIFWRPIIDILAIAALFEGYWQVTLILGIIGILLFNYYFEFIFFGLVNDALYGSIFWVSDSQVALTTITAGLIYIFLILLKGIIRR